MKMKTLFCQNCNLEFTSTNQTLGVAGQSQLNCPSCGSEPILDYRVGASESSKRHGLFVLPPGFGQLVTSTPDVAGHHSGDSSPTKPPGGSQHSCESVEESYPREPNAVELPPANTSELQTDPPHRRPGSESHNDLVTRLKLDEVYFRDHKISDSKRLPHYLIRNCGVQMDSIIERLINQVKRTSGRHLVIGWARGFANIPKLNRPLRIVEQIGEGHAVCADISFRVQDSDLYVKLQTSVNSKTLYLKWGLAVCAWLLIGPIILAIYLMLSGAHDTWINDYAQKVSEVESDGQDRKVFHVSKIKEGSFIVDGHRLIEKLRAGKIAKLSIPNIFKGIVVPELTNTQEVSQWAMMTQFKVGASQYVASSEADTKTPINVWTSASTIVMGWLPNPKYRPELLADVVVENIGNHHSSLEMVITHDRDSKYSFDFPMQGTTLTPRLKLFEYLKSVKINELIDMVYRPNAAAEIKEAFAHATDQVEPWSVWKLFRSDPKGGVFHIGPAFLIITALIGAVFWYMPKYYLNTLCRLLKWPTQDEFENHSHAVPARIQRLLSDVLLYDFGVQEKDIININTSSSS